MSLQGFERTLLESGGGDAPPAPRREAARAVVLRAAGNSAAVAAATLTSTSAAAATTAAVGGSAVTSAKAIGLVKLVLLALVSVGVVTTAVVVATRGGDRTAETRATQDAPGGRAATTTSAAATATATNAALQGAALQGAGERVFAVGDLPARGRTRLLDPPRHDVRAGAAGRASHALRARCARGRGGDPGHPARNARRRTQRRGGEAMSARTCILDSVYAVLGLALIAGGAGCSAGSDIYVEPTKTDRTSSGLCGLTPDQDVCARTFALGVGADQQARFVGFLESTTAFASTAQAARDEMSRACEAILDGLGAPRPTVAATASVQDVARAYCGAAAAAVNAKTERSAFTLTAAAPACSSVPPPACALDRTPRPHCAPSVVTLTMHDGASADAQAVGSALLKSLGLVLDVKSRFEAAAARSSSFAENAAASSAGGDGTLAASCTAGAVHLVRGAMSDIQTTTELSGQLLAAIQPEP